MNLLVTGGAGFVGTNFVNFMLDNHPEVRITVVDVLKDPILGSINREYLERRHGGRLTFIQEDILNREALQSLFVQNSFETVVHLAAIASNLRALIDPEDALRTNLEGTKNLFEVAREHGIKVFYHQSTCEVYGEHTTGISGFTSESPLNPGSPYSKSKAEADAYIISQFRDSDMRILIARTCNIYGPRLHPDNAIASFIRSAILGASLIITGDGNQTREYLHVNDACRAMDLLIQTGQHGEIYNIGSYDEVSILSLAHMIKRLSSLDLGINQIAERPSDTKLGYLLDWSKMAKLGWKPQIRLENGIQETFKWYQENRKSTDLRRELSEFMTLQERVRSQEPLFIDHNPGRRK